MTRCEERRLVDQVREIGAREPGRACGERVELDLTVERLALGVHLEDLPAAAAVRSVDDDLPVEAARAQQRGIEDVGPVRGGDEDDVVLHLEAVHLDEELVQRLLALVVPAPESGAAVAADGVDLVHEDDAGARLLRLLEQVAHTRGADPDEHLDEVRAGDGEEGHACLTGDRAGEERLTGAGRAVEEHALRDPRAERLELLRVLEELLDLVQLLDRLVGAGDVLEADLRRVGRHPLGAALAEAHHLRAAALHLVHEEDPEADQQHERQHRDQERAPPGAALALRVIGDVLRAELLLDLERGMIARIVDLELVSADERPAQLEAIRVEDGVLHVARGDALLQLGIGQLLLVLAARNQGLARQIDEQDDHDEGEERAAEKAIHGVLAEGSSLPVSVDPPRTGISGV